MKKQQLDEIIKKMIKKKLKEETAYDRGSDRNLKKSLIDAASFLSAWAIQIDKKQLESSDFKQITEKVKNLLRDLNLHSKNWDN